MSTAQTREATRDTRDDLRARAWRDDVSRSELLDIGERLASLDGGGANEVVAALSDEELGRWADEMHESSILPGVQPGLSRDERAGVHATLARDLDAVQLGRVHAALAVPARQGELVEAVERHSLPATREAFGRQVAGDVLEAGVARDIGRGELDAFRHAVERLGPAGVDALLAGTDEAALAALGDELFETRTLGVFGDRGYSAEERAGLFDTLAAKASAVRMQRLGERFGPVRGAEIAAAMTRTAPMDERVAFVQGAVRAAQPTTGATNHEYDFLSGNSWGYTDSSVRHAATVLGSLDDGALREALAGLSPAERGTLLAATADLRLHQPASFGAAGMASLPSVYVAIDTAAFTRLVERVGSLPDPALRASVLGEASTTLGTLHERHGMPVAARRELADAIVAALDEPTLAQLSPQAIGPLADAASAGGGGPSAATIAALRALPASPPRDTLARTLFAKTPDAAYARDPALGAAMAALMVATTGERLGAAARPAAREALAGLLASEPGRALLADPDIDPAARLWAAEQVMGQPAGMAALVAADANPWERASLLERHAAARLTQHALARGDQGVRVHGAQIENLVGTAAGATLREDLPIDVDAIAPALATGDYNAYEGNAAVTAIAEGIRARQHGWAVEAVDVTAVPIQFSSRSSGPIDLVVFRVAGADGQSAVVDNTGRTYDSVEQWLAENELPPGVVTYPTELRLGDGGTPPELATRVTPNVRDTAWEHVTHWADIGALALGTVASGVIVFGSGGLATPVVAGAWGVVGASTLWTTGRAVGELADRHAHDQTLAPSDPEARAAWIGVAAGGLTLAGGGASLGARLAGDGTRTAAQLARASGLLNASANYADLAATADQAGTLVTHWEDLSPAARLQMTLGIAFWGATTGANARMNDGRLADVLDVSPARTFEQRVQRALIDTGARVTPDAELLSGTASVVATPDGGFAVLHATDASPEVIAAHRRAAQDLVTNGGVEGAMARLLGAPDAFPPGTLGEAVVVEVAKHRSLLEGVRRAATDPTLTPGERRLAERRASEYEHELAFHEADLALVRADPAAASLPAPGSVDVKRPSAYRLGVIEGAGLARSPEADLPFDVIVDPALRVRYPDAVPVGLEDLGSGFTFTLSDGTVTRKSGGAGSSDLRRVLRPVSEGGWGGGIFHDPSTDTLIAAVNIRTTADPDTLVRVEVPYARDASGRWRADFEGVSPYATSMDPALPRDRPRHFTEANRALSRALADDPALAAAVALSPGERRLVDAAANVSPEPYTWHHVDGGGRIILVDEGIHAFFPHHGGFSEWGRP